MTKQTQELSDQEQDDLSEDLASDDYGFIIGSDGTLKHIFTPDDFYLDPPANVKRILKILGIKDINSLAIEGDDTLH
jgi:hypothetical protein